MDEPNDREAARAEALLRLAWHVVVAHGRTVLTTPDNDAPRIDVLIAHGLAALDGEGKLPDGVTPLPRPDQAREGR